MTPTTIAIEKTRTGKTEGRGEAPPAASVSGQQKREADLLPPQRRRRRPPGGRRRARRRRGTSPPDLPPVPLQTAAWEAREALAGERSALLAREKPERSRPSPVRRVRHAEVVLADQCLAAYGRSWLRLRWPREHGGFGGFVALSWAETGGRPHFPATSFLRLPCPCHRWRGQFRSILFPEAVLVLSEMSENIMGRERSKRSRDRSSPGGSRLASAASRGEGPVVIRRRPEEKGQAVPGPWA